MKKNYYRLLFNLIFFIILIQNTSAAHYIAGFVNNSFDGENANGHTIIIWNPSIGITDNLTDIIGPTGNSGQNNTYLIDCEVLQTPCFIGDEIRARIIDSGDGYISETTSVIVTGAGFDTMPILRINSFPTIELSFPQNYYNHSSSTISLSCIGEDFDSNLANISLYGNWSGGWHINQTISTTGNYTNATYDKTFSDGYYSWSCFATDNLSISTTANTNRTFAIDLTNPVISEVFLNHSGIYCGLNLPIAINCTATDSLTGIQSVIIQTTPPNQTLYNTTTTLIADNTYGTQINISAVGNWSFTCLAIDYAGNMDQLNATNEIDSRPVEPDINIKSTDIILSNYYPLENEIIKINSTIENLGCSDANNFRVAFYDGDPLVDGLQIGLNQTISLPALNSTILNTTWNVVIGTHYLYVNSDINNTLIEYNETNNIANITLMVTAWQTIYGNTTLDKILANANISNFTLWGNETELTGVIFIADTESNIDWSGLIAIGTNKTHNLTTNDFADIDSLLNMTGFNDSVSSLFTTDGNTPRNTTSLLINQKNITTIPFIFSTNTSVFFTGILWDSTDDISDGEYSQDDREDLIFVANVNKGQQGAYGLYDYEITYPVRLREYFSPDNTDVYLYFDLN